MNEDDTTANNCIDEVYYNLYKYYYKYLDGQIMKTKYCYIKLSHYDNEATIYTCLKDNNFKYIPNILFFNFEELYNIYIQEFKVDDYIDETNLYGILIEKYGQTLKNYFINEGIINSEIIFKLLNILIEMYKIGILHNDLKLDNILIGNEGIKLIDFDKSEIMNLHKLNLIQNNDPNIYEKMISISSTHDANFIKNCVNFISKFKEIKKTNYLFYKIINSLNVI